MSRTNGVLMVTALAGAVVLVAMATLPLASQSNDATSRDGILGGTITSATGEPMEGVTASARAPAASFTTSVLTDANGEYYFPPSPAGMYKVWAQAVGYEAGRAEVNLQSGHFRSQDFTLKTMANFEAQLPGDQWMAALPEDTLENRKMKEVFRLACNGCHTQNFTLLTRFDEKGWRNIIATMSKMAGYGYGDPAVAAKRPTNPLMKYYGDQLAAWLAEMRGPGPSPMKFTPRPRPTDDATLAVVRTYDAPEAGYGYPLYNDGSDWSLGSVDFFDHEHHHVMLATLDFDGNLWVSDFFPAKHRSVIKIDWKTGQTTPFKVPGRSEGELAASHDIKTDKSGMIWFDVNSTSGIGAFGRIDPRTGKLDIIEPPEGMKRVGAWIDLDPVGGVWSNSSGGAVRFDLKTKTWMEFVNPPLPYRTYGMAGDREGNGWWSMFPAEVVIRGDIQTGETEAIEVPRAQSSIMTLFTPEERELFARMHTEFKGEGKPGAQGIRKMGGDPARNVVWGPTWFGNNLLKIDIHTKQITVYPFPVRYVEGYDADVDDDGMVWVMFTNSDMIGKFDPDTETWTTYDLPTRGTKSHGLQAVTVNGRTQIAMAHLATGNAEKMEFRTREELQALQATAQNMPRAQ